MAIKIVKKPPESYRVECPYCRAIFEYSFEDIEARYVKCPCCSEYAEACEDLNRTRYRIKEDGTMEMIPTVESVRADTVREMHSKIKERCIKGGIYPAFVANVIDQIAKEMMEDDDGTRT